MKAFTTAIGSIAAIAVSLAIPAAALADAEAVVPPENSAATQYTEALPTAGGNKETGGKGGQRSPAKVLGAHNAHRLESHGKQGREVAKVVAETAPETSVPAEESPAPRPEHSSSGGGAGKAENGSHPRPHHAIAHVDRTLAPNQHLIDRELPSGSSGLGEVLAAATGSSSSGQLGLLLPLAIAAAIAWSLVYLWRQRRQAG
jgi:hypothetical protein